MVATLWTCLTVYGFLFDYCILCCGYSVYTSLYSYSVPYVRMVLMDVHSSTRQKLTQVNSSLTWIHPLNGNSNVAVSGNMRIRKKDELYSDTQSFCNGGLCRGMSFHEGHMSLPMSLVKSGLNLIFQNPLIVAMKRVISYCYCVSSLPHPWPK
jgi:hypothetical protein